MKRILSLSVAGTAVIAFLAASLNQPVRELTSRELAAIRGGAPFDGCATNCDCAVDCQYDASTDTCTRCKAPAGGGTLYRCCVAPNGPNQHCRPSNQLTNCGIIQVNDNTTSEDHRDPENPCKWSLTGNPPYDLINCTDPPPTAPACSQPRIPDTSSDDCL